MRAEFRQFASDKVVIVKATAGQGTAIIDNRLHISLEEAQTVRIKISGLVTNFVVERDQKEIAIGVIMIAPVVLLLTRPRA